MPTSSPLSEITDFLNKELRIEAYSDLAFNGLQIESGCSAISKVGFAVDAGLSVMEQAIALGCQLLVVHHGVMWGKVEPVVGPWARKLALCLSHNLSLYASHLPLDGHPTLGNAAQLAKVLNATTTTPAFEIQGAPIGTIADLPRRMSISEIAATLASCEGSLNPPLILPFGRPEVESVAIVTGSATSLLPEVSARKLDLLITGEPKQEAYHTAKELKCSLLCIGHYASETFGVLALERILRERFRVETAWISEPTGI